MHRSSRLISLVLPALSLLPGCEDRKSPEKPTNGRTQRLENPISAPQPESSSEPLIPLEKIPSEARSIGAWELFFQSDEKKPNTAILFWCYEAGRNRPTLPNRIFDLRDKGTLENVNEIIEGMNNPEKYRADFDVAKGELTLTGVPTGGKKFQLKLAPKDSGLSHIVSVDLPR